MRRCGKRDTTPDPARAASASQAHAIRTLQACCQKHFALSGSSLLLDMRTGQFPDAVGYEYTPRGEGGSEPTSELLRGSESSLPGLRDLRRLLRPLVRLSERTPCLSDPNREGVNGLVVRAILASQAGDPISANLCRRRLTLDTGGVRSIGLSIFQVV